MHQRRRTPSAACLAPAACGGGGESSDGTTASIVRPLGPPANDPDVVAAAGHDASETRRQYPAAEGTANLLSVGAGTASTALAEFSKRGSWVQITAPGEGVTSSVPGGGRSVSSGTSMSAPLVAGAAAALREALPDLSAIELAQRMTARSGRLYDDSLPRLDLVAALQDTSPTEPVCK